MKYRNNIHYVGALVVFFYVIIGTNILWAQTATNTKPKLVVGIVVDQMRFDYLYKYESKYGEGGFKRIMREGFNFKNTQFNYVPTVTAAGHASIYTGTTPSSHGIIGNSWYDRKAAQIVSNVGDDKVIIVGSQQPDSIGLSPNNLLTTTIGDQLRLASNFKSKVISVSLKDRGAIIPGGHTANAAYWHSWQTSPGYFVSSSYYMDQVPSWVNRFNKQEKTDAYLNETWETLYPIEDYTESAPDNNPYESLLRGQGSTPTFPYDFKSIRESRRESGTEYHLIWASPLGNTLLTEFALEAIKNEELGKDEATDLINISYSVPDIIGHTFGPQSVELQDTYLRLDKDIEQLLLSLDNDIGQGNYVVFLTSDHGVMPTASYAEANKMPAGIAALHIYSIALNNFLNDKYGNGEWVEIFNYENVYLNKKLIKEKKVDLRNIRQATADFLITQPGIVLALTADHLRNNYYDSGLAHRIQNGYHPMRSGDVVLNFLPGYVQNATPGMKPSLVRGTTHGSGYAYDTHVPMVWMGKGIPHGESVREVSITDVAPTLAMFLNLQLPNGSSGKPLKELFD
ncbi:MAG: alkaline phosphatase PafA [Flavobacteriaceae bacterium]